MAGQPFDECENASVLSAVTIFQVSRQIFKRIVEERPGIQILNISFKFLWRPGFGLQGPIGHGAVCETEHQVPNTGGSHCTMSLPTFHSKWRGCFDSPEELLDSFMHCLNNLIGYRRISKEP